MLSVSPSTSSTRNPIQLTASQTLLPHSATASPTATFAETSPKPTHAASAPTPKRDLDVICVVEESKDVQAIERTREFHGRYHVLGGALDPLKGIGPDQLNIRNLLTRIAQPVEDYKGDPTDIHISEVILATNPNTVGEATASYLARILKDFPNLTVSRLATGLSMGGDIEFADELTLGRALQGRRSIF